MSITIFVLNIQNYKFFIMQTISAFKLELFILVLLCLFLLLDPTDCIKAQLKYDERKKDGTLGHLELRPQCDKYGFFSPVMCIPGEM